MAGLGEGRSTALPTMPIDVKQRSRSGPRAEDPGGGTDGQSADRELVHAARAGDRNAFAALYQRYRGPVHAVILARVPTRDAGDLVQDVFVTALRRLGTLREIDAFAGWLLTIARNRATDHLRRSRPMSELPEELPSARAAQGQPRAEAARALAAIRSLPDTYRETLLMRLLEGMTGPEIARRTGLKPESVRVNLHRGMKLLRAKLEVER